MRFSFSILWAASLAGACSGGGPAGQPDGSTLTCTIRLDCPGRLGCVDGVCGPCLRDRDCLATEFCSPQDNLCHSLGGDECRINDECSLGSFCVQGWCKQASEVTPCLESLDCAEGERCDPLNLVCVPDLGCDRDAECATGEVCDLAARRCVRACTPETEDVICGAGLVCDSFGRCVECYSDQQCGVGLHCNLDTMRCQGENSCLTSRDCLPGQVCNPQTFQCTSSPPPCLANADCPAGRVCNPNTGRCQSADCQPDRLEPNNSSQAAAPLSSGNFDQLVLCPGDVDWYGLQLARADRLLVIVNTNFLAADRFQTVLFSPELQLLQEGSLLIDATVSQDGLYFLRCQTLDPQAEYQLAVTVSRGLPCDDDAFEPNDNALQARALAAGEFGPLAICPHDEDWYAVQRTPTQRLRVVIGYPAAEGDLDLDLLAGDGQTLLQRSAGAGDVETVEAAPGPSTRFFVRVWARPESKNRYDLSVSLED